MSEHLPHQAKLLPRDVVVIDDQGERRFYLLKCSRRRLGVLLDAALQARRAEVT